MEMLIGTGPRLKKLEKDMQNKIEDISKRRYRNIEELRQALPENAFLGNDWRIYARKQVPPYGTYPIGEIMIDNTRKF